MMPVNFKDEPDFPSEAAFRMAIERGLQKRRKVTLSRELLEDAEKFEAEAYGSDEPKNKSGYSYHR